MQSAVLLLSITNPIYVTEHKMTMGHARKCLTQFQTAWTATTYQYLNPNGRIFVC